MTPNWLDCCVDVSHNNGPIDWAAVDPAITLVFVKASQGASFDDPRFLPNSTGAAASGRMVVPYHFFDSSNIQSQIIHFQQFCTPGKPFMVDWEGRASQAGAPEDVELFGTHLAAALGGVPIVGYWGIPGSTPARPTPVMSAWLRFVPRYPLADAASLADLSPALLARMAADDEIATASFWQYTSAGKVAGIDGAVDRSVWHGTADALRAWYNGTSTGATA